MSKDRERVQRVLAGDVSGFAELYDLYAPMVRAICYGATEEFVQAQDLAQEVFLRAHDKLDKLRHPERFAGWLVGIARRVCKEWRRGRLRDRHQYVGRASTVSVAGEAVSISWEIERLLKTITLLPEKEQLALRVFYLQGQTVEQAYAALGMSRSGMYKVLQRARNRLERLMRESGEDIS